MNINANTPFHVFLTNFFIIALIAAVTFFTSNPLALLGLFYLQNIPVFQTVSDEDGGYDFEGDEGKRPTAPGDDYAGTKAGFTANV